MRQVMSDTVRHLRPLTSAIRTAISQNLLALAISRILHSAPNCSNEAHSKAICWTATNVTITVCLNVLLTFKNFDLWKTNKGDCKVQWTHFTNMQTCHNMFVGGQELFHLFLTKLQHQYCLEEVSEYQSYPTKSSLTIQNMVRKLRCSVIQHSEHSL
jgi:hypothetical protein